MFSQFSANPIYRSYLSKIKNCLVAKIFISFIVLIFCFHFCSIARADIALEDLQKILKEKISEEYSLKDPEKERLAKFIKEIFKSVKNLSNENNITEFYISFRNIKPYADRNTLRKISSTVESGFMTTLIPIQDSQARLSIK